MKRFAIRRYWPAVIALITMAASSSVPLSAQTWITGYYSARNGTLSVGQVPWDKYTHIIHFAASTTGVGDVIPYYIQSENLVAARPLTSATKVLVALKDYDSNYNAFPASASPANIATFVQNIVQFVNDRGYDGVDVDWEKNVNVTQFDDLLTRLKAALPGKVITMAANPGNSQVAGDSQANLDQVNVMCYDLDWGSSFSWYVGPLFQSGNPNVFTCDWDVQYFTSKLVPRTKIGVGMPFYGRRWPGVTQALQRSSFNNAITFFYRDLASDTTRWKPDYQFYDRIYGANYLSINAGNLTEFDSYTGPEFIQDAVRWQQAQGFGGFMTFTVEYEYLPALADPFPLSSALYNAVHAGATFLPPSGLTAIPGNTQVSLTWLASVGAVSYNVKRGTSNGGPYTTVRNVATNSCTDTGLTNGTNYYYVVSAINSSGQETADSSQVSATPTALTGAPAPPVGVTATAIPIRKIALTWNASATATSYKAYRSKASTGPYSKIAEGISSTSYTDSGLINKTTYYYVITAVNPNGESGYSAPASAQASSK